MLSESDVNKTGQWDNVSEMWDLIGSPLRPCGQDVDLIVDSVSKLIGGNTGPLKILILGVTPEFAELPIAQNCQTYAIDRSINMIHWVWTGEKSNAICGDWHALPWDDDTFDLVICDGGLQLIDYPQGIKELVMQVERVLKSKGVFVSRLFCPPLHPETPGQVISSLLSGDINDTNELKLRIWSSLQQSSDQGVVLNDVWHYLNEQLGSWQDLARTLGWSLDCINVLDLYQGNYAKMHFAHSKDMVELIIRSSSCLCIKEVVNGVYNLSERCPILVFQHG